ncbi:hypothetical protein VL16_15770 [Chromobacterium violaceum]|nr:hypothetical protein VK93_11960 [Chromobacterium violaceum]KMO02878.1 hypothetical protein VL16_15770 [Chromobacterium violaceum]
MNNAAKRLQISVQQASTLLLHGILSVEPTISREVRVTETSLSHLFGMITSPSLVTVEKAAELCGYTEHLFQVYFIETEVVSVFDLRVWRLVRLEDLSTPLELKKSFLSAAEAGAMFDMHRSFLPNLERRGEIRPHVIGKKRKVKFYSRESISQVAVKLGLYFDQN